MMTHAMRMNALLPHPWNRWFQSPVTFFKGAPDEIARQIPDFGRRSFGLTGPGSDRTRLNERFDLVLRRPLDDDTESVPIGIVSKRYTLVPHRTVLDFAVKALQGAGIALQDMRGELRMTEYGERMELSLFLPSAYDFVPADGHPMSLRLECYNSVDGSSRFRAMMGWYRIICSNGLVVGVTHFDVRRRHAGDLGLNEIGQVLGTGVRRAERDKKRFHDWTRKQLTNGQLETWADDRLRNAWGFKAAARAYHIACTGRDARIRGPYTGHRPTTIPVNPVRRVPGAPGTSRNLFDLSQVLAWLAQERRDIQEQLEWREQIAGLLRSLSRE